MGDNNKHTNSYPHQVSSIESHNLWDEAVLYSPTQVMAFSLNHSAKAIWELCDGKHTIVEISEELGQNFDRSGAELLSEVEETVIQLHELGLLEL